jgi:hypothetical protein
LLFQEKIHLFDGFRGKNRFHREKSHLSRQKQGESSPVEYRIIFCFSVWVYVVPGVKVQYRVNHDIKQPGRIIIVDKIPEAGVLYPGPLPVFSLIILQ